MQAMWKDQIVQVGIFITSNIYYIFVLKHLFVFKILTILKYVNNLC